MSQKLKKERSSRLSEDLFGALFDNEFQPMLLVEPRTSAIVDANPAACSLYGYPRSKFVRLKTTDINTAPESEVRAAMSAAAAGIRNKFEFRHRLGSGEVRDIEDYMGPVNVKGQSLLCSLVRDVTAPRRTIGTVQDITECERREASLRRLNRALHVLSACNQTLIHAESEEELLTGICRAIVEKGGFEAALIGHAERDAAKTVRFVARAGFEGDISTIKVTWADDELGRGSLGTAIRTGKTVVFNDVLNDKRFAPWREEILKRAFRSVAAFPIVVNHETFGALSVCGTAVGEFDQGEVDQLEELAFDLGYGISVLRARAEREEALNTLKIRNMAVASALSPIATCDLKGNVTYANQAALNLWGHKELASVRGLPLPTFSQGNGERPAVLDELRRNGKAIGTIKTQDRAGSPLVLQYSANMVTDAAERPVETMFCFADVTDRERAETQRREYAEKLRTALIHTIQALGLTVEKRDPYTAGHQHRAADLARAIAQEMGLCEERVTGLYMAGLIHDIGKIYIPLDILAKPGKLTPEEFALVKTHPAVGYEIVKDVVLPWPAAEMILRHHERLDGSGYPHGLRGDAIGEEARILAVADVVEAMSSHRPYRAARGIDAALVEILSNRGTRYDGAAVDACVKLLRSGKFVFQ